VPDPVVGILIRTRIGLNVCGTNTELEKLKFGHARRRCAAAQLHIPLRTLPTGVHHRRIARSQWRLARLAGRRRHLLGYDLRRTTGVANCAHSSASNDLNVSGASSLCLVENQAAAPATLYFWSMMNVGARPPDEEYALAGPADNQLAT
jgi:hypothetical protein